MSLNAENIYPLSNFKGREGYVNAKGEWIIKPKFKIAGFFSNSDSANVAVEGAKWGTIDKTGKFIIKPRFNDALYFSEGLAEVKINKKYGFIDKTGKIIIQPQFDEKLLILLLRAWQWLNSIRYSN